MINRITLVVSKDETLFEEQTIRVIDEIGNKDNKNSWCRIFLSRERKRREKEKKMIRIKAISNQKRWNFTPNPRKIKRTKKEANFNTIITGFANPI